MKAIKIKPNFEGTRAVDKAAMLSARVKNSYICTKQAAEETKDCFMCCRCQNGLQAVANGKGAAICLRTEIQSSLIYGSRQ